VRVSSGRIHGVHLGHTRVVRLFGKLAFGGTIASFCAPYFRVEFDDGDSADYRGHEIAPNIVYGAKELEDPRLWSGDYSYLHMADVPGFRTSLLGHLNRAGIKVPSAWIQHGGTTGGALRLAGCMGGDPIEVARAEAEAEMDEWHSGFLEQTRNERTIRNYRNSGIQLLHHCVSMGIARWPSSTDVAKYLAKLASTKDNVGAPATAKLALGFLCSINNVDKSPYDSQMVTAGLEAMRRRHAGMTKKSAGLSAEMVRAIMVAYGVPRPRRARDRQWELALCVSIGLGYKLLLRYADLSVCRWDRDFCEVYDTHVRFFLQRRKTHQYGGMLLDVACPEDPTELGVYHFIVRARSVWKKGFVLPHICRKTGRVDSSRPMPYKTFVLFLRSALMHIGVSAEAAKVFSAQCMRGGGATEAAVHGLSPAEIQHLAGVKDPNWLAYYNRNYLGERLRVSRALGL